jgi:hypothetical protein
MNRLREDNTCNAIFEELKIINNNMQQAIGKSYPWLALKVVAKIRSDCFLVNEKYKPLNHLHPETVLSMLQDLAFCDWISGHYEIQCGFFIIRYK